MAADEDDLLGKLGAANLADHVVRKSIGQRLRVDLHRDTDGAAVFGGARQRGAQLVGGEGRERGARNWRLTGWKACRAGMRHIVVRVGERTRERARGAVLRGVRRAFAALV